MVSKYQLFPLILLYWFCFKKSLSKFSYDSEALLFCRVSSCGSWTEEEKEAVFKHLSSFVTQGQFAGKSDCENCISKSNGVEQSDWCAVKYFVKNQPDKRKRVLAPKNS